MCFWSLVALYMLTLQLCMALPANRPPVILRLARLDHRSDSGRSIAKRFSRNVGYDHHLGSRQSNVTSSRRPLIVPTPTSYLAAGDKMPTTKTTTIYGEGKTGSVPSSVFSDRENQMGYTVTAPLPDVTGAIGVNNIDADNVWTVEMEIGNPRSNFSLLLSFTEPGLWVGLDTCQECQNITLLNTTSLDGSNPRNTCDGIIGINSGNFRGLMVQADMAFGGFELIAEPILGVTEIEDFSGFDGIFGLGFATPGSCPPNNVVQDLAFTRQIPSAMFGLALSALSSNATSELSFGGADESRYDPSTTQTLPLVSANGLWQVQLGLSTINGKPFGNATSAIMDPSSSSILMPQKDAKEFFEAIPEARPLNTTADGTDVDIYQWSVPCNLSTTLAIQLGEAVFELDPLSLISQPVKEGGPVQQCISAVNGITANPLDVPWGTQAWVLGGAFLEQVYFAGNFEEKWVQVSKRIDNEH